ncbi:hypothetical protein Lesp02_02270 [Lentzea sp. NBRC 105346]|uniref:hypothetical protein n=1 Tax=Lentzea sp. NBRC 105346 TaxID=3032205 RepID=UPI0024A3700C|nr:hypothetical protein Lesp02_02270 [Lentzea sp. NBRC 105346]
MSSRVHSHYQRTVSDSAISGRETRQRRPCAPEPLLRYREGTPISSRRYDHLWERIGTHLPWVATRNISTHWLRHTTLTWVERHFGHAIAHAYAGHTDNHHHHHDSTSVYTRAQLPEIAAALAALVSETHPLAEKPFEPGVTP